MTKYRLSAFLAFDKYIFRLNIMYPYAHVDAHLFCNVKKCSQTDFNDLQIRFDFLPNNENYTTLFKLNI